MDTSGHGRRSDDHVGVGTVMIAGGAVSHRYYRITGVSDPQHAEDHDLAEAPLSHQRRQPQYAHHEPHDSTSAG